MRSSSRTIVQEPRVLDASLLYRLRARLFGTRVVEILGPALFVFYRYKGALVLWRVR